MQYLKGETEWDLKVPVVKVPSQPDMKLQNKILYTSVFVQAKTKPKKTSFTKFNSIFTSNLPVLNKGITHTYAHCKTNMRGITIIRMCHMCSK